MASLIGQSIGRYHILEQLGEGGMASVYKAYDTNLERDVAIKVIRTDQFPPALLAQVLKRFEREAKVLARLTHLNIVPIIDYGEYQGSPYLVMPFLPGGTFKSAINKPLPWQQAINLIRPIAQALAYAHGHNIIHRDIKPANILLTETGQPLLSDFGIARILESDQATALTTTGMGVGTPEYMAPEQWFGQAGPLSDLYSLGVVLYELVTGRKPYTADTPAAIMIKQANDPLPRPRLFVAELPDELEKVLFKALAKRPEDRYQSMAGFDAALESLTGDKTVAVAGGLETTHRQVDTTTRLSGGAGKPALPPTPEVPEISETSLKSRKWGRWVVMGGILASACLLLAAFAIGGWYIWQNGQANKLDNNQSPAATNFQNTEPSTPVYTAVPSVTFAQTSLLHAETNTLISTKIPSETFTPTPSPIQSSTHGDWVAYAYGPLEYRRNLYEMNWRTGETRQITFGDLGDNGPSFSPDGNSLVFWRNSLGDCRIVTIDGTGMEVQLTDHNSKWPSWCKDPSKPWIIYEDRADEGKVNIWLIDLANDRKARRLTNGGNDRGPEWSPDCGSFTFFRKTGNFDDIFIYDLASGETRQLTNTPEADEWTVRWSPDGKSLVYNQLRDTDGDGFINTNKDVSDLMIINSDGTGMHALTSGQYLPYSPSFSPDGTRILFTNSTGIGTSSLVIYDLQQKDFNEIKGDGPIYHSIWGP
jgi:serine/threonine protein kinase